VYDSAAAATHAVAVLNSLSDRPAVLTFSIDSADECKVMCTSTRAKKLNLKQQKWVRAALHNKTTGGKSAHHVAMGTLVAAYAIVMHDCTRYNVLVLPTQSYAVLVTYRVCAHCH
jgi:hypothetical protein